MHDLTLKYETIRLKYFKNDAMDLNVRNKSFKTKQ